MCDNRPPLISIVIPCYNHGKYLSQSIGSALAQTYPNVEIIVVDDGSTDETHDLCAFHGESLRYIKQANQGPAAARNTGIRAARGSYICPLDADDMLEPDFLTTVFAVLESNVDVGYVYTNIKYFGEPFGDVIQLSTRDRTWSEADMLYHNPSVVTALFRKSDWERIGGYASCVNGFEDWDFWLSMAELGRRGHFIDEHLFLYRKHKVSRITEGWKHHAISDYQKFIERHEALFRKHWQYLILRFFRTMVYYRNKTSTQKCDIGLNIIQTLWQSLLDKNGYQRILLYGAGKHTHSLLSAINRESGPEIVAIIDDDKKKQGKTIEHIPVLAPQNAIRISFDAVLLSTDTFQTSMLTRCRETFGQDVLIVDLYNSDINPCSPVLKTHIA